MNIYISYTKIGAIVYFFFKSTVNTIEKNSSFIMSLQNLQIQILIQTVQSRWL